MKKLLSLVITHALLLSLLAPVAAAQQPTQQPSRPVVQPILQPERREQRPRQTPTPRPSTTTASQQQPMPGDDDEDDVVRITTNLVQVDAVVTDKKGNQVTDLTAEDFEIYEDKRAQEITNFSYIYTESPAPSPAPPQGDALAKKGAKNAPLVPPRRLRPEQVRRTMALVVDDLGLSFPSMGVVRDSLRKYINEQMQPNDLVAIIRTSAGMSALQQFTSDKRQLHAIIDKVKWYPGTRGGTGIYPPIRNNIRSTGPAFAGDASEFVLKDGIREDALTGRSQEFQEEIFTVGTLGAMNFVVRSMRDLPGRKSVTLFSDGFALTSGGGRLQEALRRLTDLANRASVVFYTVDPRGLMENYGFTAEDDTAGMNLEQLDQVQVDRARLGFLTQGGPDHLSEETGGFSVKNSNDINKGLRRIVEDQRGYYLLGYRPQSATFDSRYHKLEVRVKRPGLSVRYRKGFFGVKDEETRLARRTREEQLFGALISQFGAADVRVRLTALFGNSTDGGSFMTSLMHIKGDDVRFTRQPDGTYKTVLDVVGVTFTINGQVVDSREQTTTLTMKEEAYRRALEDGLIYTFTVPIKKAGAYQLRMAVRDSTTGKTGAASQFIEVPDLKKNRLALSGLLLSGLREETTKKVATNGVAASAEQETYASPALRRFRQHTSITYGYMVYNARLDKATGRPHLTTRTRIYREGELVYNGADEPLALSQSPDLRRITALARLQLGSNLTPGDYVLQVIVTDHLAKEGDKTRFVTQWADFEITGADAK